MSFPSLRRLEPRITTASSSLLLRRVTASHKKTLVSLAASFLVPLAASHAENADAAHQRPAVSQRMELKTKSLALEYQVDREGRLSLEKTGSQDGSWTSPLNQGAVPHIDPNRH